MITTYHGDMLEEIKNVKDGSIRLLLTDPPYNISRKLNCLDWEGNTATSMQFDEEFKESWDTLSEEDFIAEMQKWCDAWFPKLMKGGSFAVFISDKYLSHLWTAMEKSGFAPKRVWTWKKPAAIPFNRKFNPISGAEYIIWGIKPGATRVFNADAVKGTIVERHSLADKISSILYKHIKESAPGKLAEAFDSAKIEALKVEKNLKCTGDIVHCVVPNTITLSGGTKKKDKIHPTQKPLELLQYFVTLLSNPNELVLDTFAGSGSTGIAADTLGRDCILIEQDEEMFNKMDQKVK